MLTPLTSITTSAARLVYGGTSLGRIVSFCTGKSRGISSRGLATESPEQRYDVVIVGAGHNGLVCAAYLAKRGLKICVLEKRHLIGGAAVTEEIIPGYKFSRASYVLSLFRPDIIADLNLKSHGLKMLARDPYSYTPMSDGVKGGGSLLLGKDSDKNYEEIAKFSVKDAKTFGEYEDFLKRISLALDPLIDAEPVNFSLFRGNNKMVALRRNRVALITLYKSLRRLTRVRGDTARLYELMTSPADRVLSRWFESEPLKATLAMDACIGSMTSPRDAGTGYVLLHHVMGDTDGEKGAWAYVEGGMGSVSNSIAKEATLHGAHIHVNSEVSQILVDEGSSAIGVALTSGRTIAADVVVSNCTTHVTYQRLLADNVNKLDVGMMKEIANIDYSSPVAKINVAVNRLPDFLSDPHGDDLCPPTHRGSIHLNCEHTDNIHRAYVQCSLGQWPKRPVIEMTIPSVLDPTLAPRGHHVVQLFVQYVPYELAEARVWDHVSGELFCDHVFDNIERYAPGFKASVIGRDVLTPVDLETIFSLTGGNIFHGAMSLSQLYSMRPCPSLGGATSSGRKVNKLYCCGASRHPGGGVMGVPGKLAAQEILGNDFAK